VQAARQPIAYGCKLWSRANPLNHVPPGKLVQTGKVATPVCNQLSVKVRRVPAARVKFGRQRGVGAAGVAAVIVAGPDQGPAALA